MKEFQKSNLKLALLVILALGALVLLIHSGLSFAKQPVVLPSELQTRKYEETELSALEALGYSELRGSWVKNINGKNQTDLIVRTWCLRGVDQTHLPVRCVFGVETLLGYAPNGKPVWHTEDALEVFLKPRFKLFDDGDENCTSSLYPKLSAIAIGIWQWKKKPEIGGYAHSIKQAWVIDTVAKKILEVPTSSVSCEINDDRD